MNNTKRISTRKMVIIGMMTALATIVYYLDFPVPFMPGFIKLDFSNVISLLTGFALGPVEGVIVCLLKNLIHLLIKGIDTTMGIGDIFDFVTSATSQHLSVCSHLQLSACRSTILSCTRYTSRLTAEKRLFSALTRSLCQALRTYSLHFAYSICRLRS